MIEVEQEGGISADLPELVRELEGVRFAGCFNAVEK